MTATIPILSAAEIRAAHADAEAEAVAAETALTEAETAATEARNTLAGMEDQLRDGGPQPGVDAFHAASVAVRHAELAVEGARNRALAARAEVPDMARDLAIAAAKEYADSAEYAAILEANDQYVAALTKLRTLTEAHRAKVGRLARELVESGVPWAQSQRDGEFGYGGSPAVWHGQFTPPSSAPGREFGKRGAVYGFTVTGVTMIADEFDRIVRNPGR